jgi:hypothetical protein
MTDSPEVRQYPHDQGGRYLKIGPCSGGRARQPKIGIRQPRSRQFRYHRTHASWSPQRRITSGVSGPSAKLGSRRYQQRLRSQHHRCSLDAYSVSRVAR